MQPELMALERDGWEALCRGTAIAFYDRLLSPDAVFVVPGMVLTRDETLESWRDADPWQSYELFDERTVPLGRDAAVLTYAGTATRSDGSVYNAQFTSIYVRNEGAWHLAFHQQTPN